MRRIVPGIMVSALAVSALAQGIPWRNQPSAKPLVRGDVAATLAELAIAEQQRFIARFSAPVTDQTRAELSAAGVELMAYLGEQSYFASAAGGVPSADALVGVGTLSAIEAIDPAVKIHPMLWNGETPTWAVVGEAADGSPVIGVYVLLHPDAALGADVPGLMGLVGGDARDLLETINGVVAELPMSQVLTLAQRDEVQWIEPALPTFSTMNAENRAITGADIAQAAPYGLDGTGVTAMIYDGGTARATHVDFNGRLTKHDNSSQSTHPTHVAATVGGSGTANLNNRGMAPNATLLSFGFQSDFSGIFLYTNPGDIEADYNNAINNLGADISNNSIGTNTETNGFPCSIQGDYGVTSALIDNIVRGSLGSPFRIVWAAGNERQGSSCDIEGFGDYYSTAPPAGAKNHLTVGALNANDDSMTSFSSWGPTDDGRLKPDVSAPGCQSNGDGGVTSASNSGDSSYAQLCGTSMASPTVCGLACLLLEDFRVQFPGKPDPRNSTLKTLFAHSAQDRGNVGPDYQFGYGSVRIVPTIDHMRTGNFQENSVGQGGVVTFDIVVAPGTPQLRVTAAWDDAPGTPNVSPALVNDLDVRVFNPSNTEFFAWTLNPNNPGASAVQNTYNRRDNIEQVLVNNPVVGTWRVEVVGFNVAAGPQIFSIAGTPNLSEKGVKIELDAAVPAVVTPGTVVTVPLTISAIGETIVAGSERLFYRANGGAFVASPLSNLGGGSYEATLPAAVCGTSPEFYFSVDGSLSGQVTNPADAPTSVFSFVIGETVTIESDDLETNSGWTVGAAGDNATTGLWERVNPQGTDAQPEDDVTPGAGVNCFVTDGDAGTGVGSFDVDGGTTTLVSRSFDLSSGVDPTLSYWRWYSNVEGGAPNADTFVVDISNNGGASWTNVEVVGPTGLGTSGGWIQHSFRVADKIAPTSNMRLRFIASDLATGSIIEAAVDEVTVTDFVCEGAAPCPGDLTGDGLRDQNDLNILLSGFGCGGGGCNGDVDGDGDTDQDDLNLLLSNFGVPCP